MKKVLSLVAVLAAWTLVLTGCNKTENVDEVNETPVVEASTTSLDLGGLISITENNFPKSYTFTKYNMATNESEGEGRHVYNGVELGFLTPEYSNIVDREVTSSGIEDGMIYTMVDGKLGDESVSILYINDPDTLRYAFATVYRESETTLYTFSY